MVIFSHSYELLGEEAPSICLRSPGNFAVHCFFAISGYLITLSFLKQPILYKFVIKRVLRLLPAFVVAYVLTKVIGSVCDNFVNNPVPYIVNGSIWTLSYEIACYILVAFLGVLGLLSREVIGSMYLIGMVLIVIFINNSSPVNTIIVPLLFCFLGGVYIALSEKKLNMKFIGVCAVVLILLINFFPTLFCRVFAVLPWIYGPNFEYAILNYFIYLIALPFAIIYLGKYCSKNIIVQNDVSYGLYIYAWPIQQTVILGALKNDITIHPCVLFVISFILTYLVSFMSWKYVESPAMKAKDFMT